MRFYHEMAVLCRSRKGKQRVVPSNSSGALLKDMIHMLDYILKASVPNTTEGQQEIRVARILLCKVFYDHTDNEILPFIFKLMKTIDIHKQPRSQLAGLVETTHIVLRLLISITKQDGALRVKKKVRVAKKKTRRRDNCSIGDLTSANVPNLHNRNRAMVPESEGDATDKVEANAAVSSETQVEPEDANVIAPVLNDEHPEHANSNPGPVGDLEVPSEERHRDNTEEPDNNLAGDREECEEGESDYDSEEEEEEMQTKEKTLDVFKCVRMFADNTIVHNYCWLLKNYLHNTPAINYYIVRMLWTAYLRRPRFGAYVIPALNITNLLRDSLQPNDQKLRPASVRDLVLDETCPSSLREAQNVAHVVCGPSFLEIKTGLSLHNSQLRD